MNEKHICLKKNLSLGPSLVYMICFNHNHAGLKLDFALNKKNKGVLMVSIDTVLFERPNIKQDPSFAISLFCQHSNENYFDHIILYITYASDFLPLSL